MADSIAANISVWIILGHLTSTTSHQTHCLPPLFCRKRTQPPYQELHQILITAQHHFLISNLVYLDRIYDLLVDQFKLSLDPIQSSHSRDMKLIAIFVYGALLQTAMADLTVDFYRNSCPSVEQIVFSVMRDLSVRSNVVAPSVLRLFFHDCFLQLTLQFLQGCDASIMIKSTPFNIAERDLPENNIAQNAFDAISAIKAVLERSCPAVVSCADIIAMAARDAVILLGGPSWPVQKGRLDGLVSQAALSTGKLPTANMNVGQLSQSFASIGLSLWDMVVLSGAHTVGFAECKEFTNRLYHFGPLVRMDPSMDKGYARQLEATCPPLLGNPGKFQALDAVTPFGFDNNYFKNLQMGRGLLFSDQNLYSTNVTREMVSNLAASPQLFFSAFSASMIKLAAVGVKTDRRFGEIRRDCTAFNPR